MKKVKALIFTAVLVIGFTSVAGAASASGSAGSGNPWHCMVPCLNN